MKIKRIKGKDLKLGMKVLNADFEVGEINRICDCKNCEERGFFEPVITYKDYEDYAGIYSKEKYFDVIVEDEEWYDLEDWVVALLGAIKEELDRVMWNLHQKEYDNPFLNTGDVFKNDMFEVFAYNWDLDAREEYQPYNFKCGDIKIRWYKWYGRDPEVNGKYSKEEYIDMFNKCMESIREMDEKDDWKTI